MLRPAITRPVALPGVAALALSLFVHVLLLGYFARLPDLEPPVSDSPALAVELLAPRPVEPDPIQPELLNPQSPATAQALPPEAEASEEAVPEPEAGEPEPSPVVVPEQRVVLRPSAAEPAADPSDKIPATRLNLSRPGNWDDLAIESPERLEGNWFKRSDTQALAARRAQQASSQALSNAQRARLGIPAEEYRALTDAGEHVKTDKGCFIKRTQQGPNGMQERWWVTGCKDGRVPSWRRKVLSFGPDHRILPDDPREP